jgi:hypothetical protein
MTAKSIGWWDLERRLIEGLGQLRAEAANAGDAGSQATHR